VVVIGAEGSGLSPALLSACALRVAIPGSGEVESLNAATSAAILLAQRWQAVGRGTAASIASSPTALRPAGDGGDATAI
jgi:rRNA methylases